MGGRSGTSRGRVWSGTLLLLFLLPAAACMPGKPPEPVEGPVKVALIGWDGATWDAIDPLLEEGKLPNLQRLLEHGSRGELIADPPMFSPTLWTTLATGFGPQEHGITSFQLPALHGEGKVLASSSHRRRAPLWKIASAQDRSVGFVGWWTTWPAEPVEGYMISDHLAYNRWDAWAEREHIEGDYLTFPPSLTAELQPYAVRPESVDEQTLAALVPFNAAERREMMQTAKPVIFHAPSVFRFGYCTDASNLRFALHMLDTKPQPDLFGLVFILSDVAGHVFWDQYDPEAFEPTEDRHLADAVPNIYRQLDLWTGDVLQKLDPDTYVIVLSDHGMKPGSGPAHPGVNPAGDHDPRGIIVVSGGGAPVGRDLGRVPQLAFAPTVLALLDLPVAEDMPEGPLEDVLPYNPKRKLRTVDTYGDGSSGIFPELPSPGEADYEERLRSLGYIK